MAVDHMPTSIEICQDPAQAPSYLLWGTTIWRGRLTAQIGVMHDECDRPTRAAGHVICGDGAAIRPPPSSRSSESAAAGIASQAFRLILGGPESRWSVLCVLGLTRPGRTISALTRWGARVIGPRVGRRLVPPAA